MYLNIIKSDKSLSKIVLRSKHPLKTAISKVVSLAIEFIRCADVDDDLISSSLEWITKDIDGYRSKIEASLAQLSQVASDIKGNWIKPETIDLFEESHIPPFYIALWVAVRGINVLESPRADGTISNEDQEILVLLSNTVGALKPLEVITSSMLNGEQIYYSRLSGAKTSKEKRKQKSALSVLVASLAENIWSTYPDLSTNAVANLIHYRIKEQLTNWSEQGCKWFIKAKLFDEVEIGMVKVNGVQTSESEKDYRYNGVVSKEDPTKMLVPIKMPKEDAIRAQIRHLKSSKGTQRITDQLREDIESIIDKHVICTDKNCKCNSL